MSLDSFLSDLLVKRITVRYVNGKIICRGAKENITEEDLGKLKDYRDSLVELASERAVDQECNFLPLSYSQQSMWAIHNIDKSNPAYNVFSIFKLSADADLDVLTQSFNILVERHSILRTRYASLDGAPIQLEWASNNLAIQGHDNASLDKQACNQWIQNTLDSPFDLEYAPSIEVHCVDNSHVANFLNAQTFSLDSESQCEQVETCSEQNERYRLLICKVHHIAMDHWSLMSFVQQLIEVYDQLRSAQAVSWHAEPYHYSQHIIQELDLVHSDKADSMLGYWQEQLAGELPKIELPVDFHYPPVQTFTGRLHTTKVTSISSERIREVAKNAGVTPFVFLLSVFELFLHRISQQNDIIVGCPSFGRTTKKSFNVLGDFVNPIAIRTQFSEEKTFSELLTQVKKSVFEGMDRQSYPFPLLVQKMGASGDVSRQPVFQVLFNWNRQQSDEAYLSPGINHLFVDDFIWGSSTGARGVTHELSLTVTEKLESFEFSWKLNEDIFSSDSDQRLISVFLNLLSAVIADREKMLHSYHLLNDQQQLELVRFLSGQNQETSGSLLVHQKISETCVRLSANRAVNFSERSLTFAELEESSNRLAHHLLNNGVQAGDRVGIYIDRSIEMVLALLASLKAGAAYVPLDPHYPEERIAGIVKDAKIKLVLTQESQLSRLSELRARRIVVDFSPASAFVDLLVAYPNTLPALDLTKSSAAYMIYTSGSTGNPKGVMVNHSNLSHFFAGMDKQLNNDFPGVWLAVTSISFDISVLELLWTLSRGYEVVIQPDSPNSDAAALVSETQKIDFSLFYFAADQSVNEQDKYKLLIEGAKFADQHGFTGVWVPERHFHEFGGAYPNPSVMAASLAAMTKNIQIRSGSVVLPLHDPIRVAEEWSMVDNLSSGRVGLSFAAGWQPNDFVLKPENFADRKKILAQSMGAILNLWEGKSLRRSNGLGEKVEVKLFPRPIQQELPIWITSAGNPETFSYAGASGSNLLTHLIGQNIRELKEKVALYRQAREAAGYDPKTGTVTLMLHTFVGEDVDSVHKIVKEPFKNYLKTSINLFKPVLELDQPDVDAAAQEELLAEQAFKRYFENNALMGTVDSCLEFINKLKKIGVDEVGCLLDFGVDENLVIESLPRLDKLLKAANRADTTVPIKNNQRYIDNYIPPEQLIREHKVTHLQCTPSYAQMLLDKPGSKDCFKDLEMLLIGGEPLPENLAEKLLKSGVKKLLNMYGPTEATIWCSCQAVHELPNLGQGNGTVSIGKALSNTQLYILDQRGQMLPRGIAGELYVGGELVTDGYFEREKLTHERFIDDPYWRKAGDSLMYRTGDVVRINALGLLEFLGRSDNQLKIRGHRIEAGEIEAQLVKQASVKQAVVVARGAASQQQLVAFVIESGEEEFSHLAIKQILSSALPQYMVPNIIVSLPEFPQTPNGKIDRKALPTPTLVADSGAFIAPESESEKRMAALWQEVLNVNAVGMGDNFFELGGHSLMAIQLNSRITSEFSLELDFTAIFEYPQFSDFMRYVELREHEHVASSAYPEIVALNSREPKPLSFAQQRLWFLDQYENNRSATYNIPLVLALKGKVDIEVLRQSFALIVSRHESLRTSFTTLDGEPVQQVLEGPQLDFELCQVESTNLDQALKEEIHKSFDLAKGPLLRIRLFEVDDKEYVLSITQHHIIGDGWSTGILIRELGECYRALLEQALPQLKPVHLQYGDFAVWQRNWLHGEVLEEKMAFWKERLDELPTMQMPIDFNRPSLVTYNGRNVFFKIDDSLVESLKNIARRTKGTFFTTLFSAFNVLISRYCGAEDVVIGTPVAGRSFHQLEDIFGFFVNMLVMRNDLSGNPSFLQLVERVTQQSLEAFVNQDVPFEQLVNSIGAERDPSRTPLFQIMFTLENEGEEVVLNFPGVQAGIEKIEYDVAKFELSLVLRETRKGLIGQLEYNTDLFKEETVERLGVHYQQLLQAIVDNPDSRIGELGFLSQEEKYRQLVSWNETRQLFIDHDLCMHELFVKQVKKTPQATAVITKGTYYCYGEIYCAAQRISAELARQCQPIADSECTTVALMLPKGALQVVAVLAVQMAGFAYVPVDTRWPPNRRKEIISASEAQVVLCHQIDEQVRSLLTETPNFIDISTTSFEQEDSLFEQPLPDVANDSIAYIIFTSGTTGKPKGVVMDHRSVVNTLLDMNQRFHVDADDRVFALSELSFDLSVYDIFGALSAGAALVIPDPDHVMEPPHWAQLCREHQVTIWNSVPALMQLYVDYLDEQKQYTDPALKEVWLSGDWLPTTLPDRIRHYFPSAHVTSLGGATEAAIWSIHFPIGEVDPQWASIPYGKALANQKFYVLNDYFQACPLGVVGNLFIAGKGLALGYWKDKKKTAASFVTHPETGERLYKTGDLGCYLSDGNIEFIGRTDFQVKVNGYRIELGEIENRLNAHPNINVAIAVVNKNDYGVNRIICYYMAEKFEGEKANLNEHSVREFLETQLPSYMMPSVFIELENLPLTPNGKVNRKMLPKEESQQGAGSEYAQPESPTEAKIAEIWTSVLKLEKVGARDNFFEIGGDSMLIVRVHRMLTQAFPALSILVVDLFRHTTVHSLAKFIDEPKEDDMQAGIEALEASASKRKSARKNKKSKRIVEKV